MKRLLAIFVVLLLALGGLFWWRKSRDANIDYYNHLYRNKFEIENGIFAFPLTENCFLGIKFPSIFTEIHDCSRYNGIPSMEDFEHYGFYKVIFEGEYRPSALLTHNYDVLSFSVFNNYAIFHLKTSSKHIHQVVNLSNGDVDEFKSSKELQNHLNILGVSNYELKSPTEWDSIWKHYGRLPWFPEHIKGK